MALAMRRKVVLVCLLLAVVQRTVGQSLTIGNDLPCEGVDPNPDPNNDRDNLSCPRTDGVLQCYSRDMLCDDTEFCTGGSDEGENLNALECDNPAGPMFACSPGDLIDVLQLCDGNEDCDGGDDETTTLCENKCLLPYYGGCSYTRECETSEFDVNCGPCLDGFGERTPVGDCSVQIRLERNAYIASEANQISEEICAVLIAASNSTINLANTLMEIGVTDIVGIITPGEVGGANGATATADFNPQAMTVTLSLSQPRDCIQVNIVNDNVIDPNEVFQVVLTTNTVNATVLDGGDTATVTINDDDIAVTAVFVPDTYNVDENVAGGNLENVCVAIISSVATMLSATSQVTVSFADGTATSVDPDQDYMQMASPNPLTFPSGSLVTNSPATSSQQCFSVPIVDDIIDEANEIFNLGLISPTNLIIIDAGRSDSTATVTITDNDIAVTAVFVPNTYNVDENVAGGNLENVCVAIISSVATMLSATSQVTVSFADGTASSQTPGQDYMQVASPNPLTFPSGSLVTNSPATSSQQCFSVPIVDDNIDEGNEIFSLGLISPINLIRIDAGRSDSTATVTIIDNDISGTVGFVNLAFRRSEGVTFEACAQFQSGGPLNIPRSVTVFTSNVGATATADDDYSTVLDPNTLTFPVGTTPGSAGSEQCFNVELRTDDIIEGDEEFFLNLLSTDSLLTIDPARQQATVTINDITRPRVGFNPIAYSVNEANTQIQVCVELFIQGALFEPLDVTLTTAEGTAMAPMDFTPFSLTLTFPINSVNGDQQCTDVMINNDDIVESSGEMFFVDLTSSGADIVPGRERATITIQDMDTAVFRIEQQNYEFPERNMDEEVCVVLDTDIGIMPSGTVIINLASESDSGAGLLGATPGDDYNSFTTSLTFPPGSTRQCTTVRIIDDDIVEPNERFNLRATTSSNDVVISNGGLSTVTILDTDMLLVRLTQSNVMVDEDVPAGFVMVCAEVVSGRLAPGETASATLATQSIGSALAPGDYRFTEQDITFTSSTIGMMMCIDVPIENDDICEGDETFRVTLSDNDPNTVTVTPTVSTVTIVDDDVARITLNVVEPPSFQNSRYLQECSNDALWFRLDFATDVRKGPGRACTIYVETEDGSAVAGSGEDGDYVALSDDCEFTPTNTFCEFHIDILDDFNAEMNESFNILLRSSDVSACTVDDDNITVTIIDDEDCDDEPCGMMEMCEELRCPNNFTCIPEEAVGDDPHFAVTLSNGKTLCYTVQGEHGFAFNLISNQKVYMNAMFVPDALREEVTWLGTMGIVINSKGYKKSNMTKLRFEAIKNKIHIDNQMVLEAQNIEKITFENGKLTISEAQPTEGYKQPFVRVDLKDVELSFSIKFMTEHLDLYWHSTGQKTADSHGLVGQFFHNDVVLDEIRKILIIPGKEPIPVQRKPLWAFMEREMGDSTNFCWVAMNPGYQGEGLIDGHYFDYLVDDVLSTEFKYKKL